MLVIDVRWSSTTSYTCRPQAAWKDTIIKRRIFEQQIRDNLDKFVLDDRNQVVDMWRNDIGLKVLQVAEGDF